MGFAVAVGVWFRLYLIADQVLLDDEWHDIYYVINKSFVYLLTHFSVPGATCIPTHLYYHFLQMTWGWSEILLRLPSLLSGILSLALFPLFVRRVVGRQATLLFTWLMALSPFLIFYSRDCRPYAPTVFLAFSAVMCAWQWSRSGRLRYGMLYVLSGSLAVYFHLFAVVAVLTPLPCMLAFRLRKGAGFPVSAVRIVTVGIILAVSIVASVGPAFLESVHTTMGTIADNGAFQMLSLRRVMSLIVGTADQLLVLLQMIFMIVGFRVLMRRDALLAVMAACMALFYAAAIWVTRPNCIQVPLVLVRYIAPLVPFLFLLASLGLRALEQRIEGLHAISSPVYRRTLAALTVFIFVGMLFWTGPLRQTYTAPNNFTQHSAFQQNYAPIRWAESFRSDMQPPGFALHIRIKQEEISPFYRQLAAEPGGFSIIEYPMMVGDHFNPYYYYQHFHRKPVCIGYSRRHPNPSTMTAGMLGGNAWVDEVLTMIPSSVELRFRNMVDLDDLQSVGQIGSRYVLFHKRFEAELSRVAARNPEVERLIEKYRALVGVPIYEDSLITVFRIHATPP